jgi:hypothetical protein
VAQVHGRRGLVGAPIALFGQVAVDVGVGDTHAAVHIAFAQALQGDLAAQLLAELLLVHALGPEAGQQPGLVQAVLARHIAQGLVHRIVVHAQARVLGFLQLGLLHDQPLQHLTGQQRLGRHLPALLGNVLRHARHAGAHLVVGHGLGIDDRHDVVGRTHTGIAAALARRRQVGGVQCTRDSGVARLGRCGLGLARNTQALRLGCRGQQGQRHGGSCAAMGLGKKTHGRKALQKACLERWL